MPAPRVSTKSQQPRIVWLAISVALAAVVFLVFGKAIHYPFINFDDQEYVFGRPEITSGVTLPGIGWALTHVHGGNWHPLTSLSHMVDCQLYGLQAGGHHFTNICLHTLAALVLFVALREMTGAFWRAAFVAALFAIHPLRVESVVWIAERKDVLSGLFFALTLLAYAWYVRQRSIARYWWVLAACGLGLISKPMLVTTPVVFLLLDYWPLRRMTELPALRRLVIEKIPLLALSVASAIATLLTQKKALGSIEELPLSWRLENALVSYVTYMWQTFWPARLAVFYPHTDGRLPAWEIFLAAIFLISLTGLAWMMRRRRPYLITGWLWFLIIFAPDRTYFGRCLGSKRFGRIFTLSAANPCGERDRCSHGIGLDYISASRSLAR